MILRRSERAEVDDPIHMYQRELRRIAVVKNEEKRTREGRNQTDVVASITTYEARVIQLRFGLEDGQGRTLKAVGRLFGVSGERVRQIEARALRKLRRHSLPSLH